MTSFKISRTIRLKSDQALPEDLEFEERPGGWVIATAASRPNWRLRFSFVPSKKGPGLHAQLNGTSYVLEPIKESSISSGSDGHTTKADLDALLTSQFPGRVRKIFVEPGSIVQTGTVLLIVEAMKMEFSIKAPIQAKITRVLVKEGGQLMPGDRYLELEEVKE